MSENEDTGDHELPETHKPEVESRKESSALAVDSSKKVAPAWKMASLFLGSLAALLTALGPFTAWINGKEQRKLQESQAANDLSLRYMDLILRQSKDLAERRVILKFLEEALAAENPKEVMLRVVKNELTSIQSADALKKALLDSREQASSLEKELQASRSREAKFLAEQALSMAAGEENTKLKAQLDEERERRQQHELELQAVKGKVLELQARLREQQGTSVINIPKEASPSADPLERFLSDSRTPQAEARIIRSLYSTCTGHGGTGSIVYFGPNQPGVLCFVGGDSVLLTEATLEVKQAPEAITRMHPRGSPSWAFTVCSYFGGELVSNPMVWDEVLCKLEDGKGIIVAAW